MTSTHHPFVFSDTTNKNGLIQECEFWTGLGDGTISGDSTVLKQFTSRLNSALDRIAPILYRYYGFDDPNHDDHPIATFNLVSGQADYTISQDDNTLDILDITDVRIFTGASETDYSTLEEMTLDDERVLTAMSPNTNDTGTPSHYLKKGNIIYLYPKPDYSATSGIKVFFSRELHYFDSTDTTAEAGIPRQFMGILPLYASYDWLLVNKPASGTLITRIEAQISKREKDLDDTISAKYPKRNIMTPSKIQYL